MPRTIDVNRIYTNEELDAMLKVVDEEITLASDLVQSYQRDLDELEANTTMSNEDKNRRRAFLENAIKESEALRTVRTNQYGVIVGEKTYRRVSNDIAYDSEINEIWNDNTLRSRGMDAIMQEERNAAMNNAASALASAARKLADERQAEQETAKPTQQEEQNVPPTTNVSRPTYIEGSDKWKVIDTSRAPIIRFEDENGIEYNYEPNTENIIKVEKIGNKYLGTFFDMRTNSWNQVPQGVKNTDFYNQLTGKWEPWGKVKAEMDAEKERRKQEKNYSSNGIWLIPLMDKDGKYLLDENGAIRFEKLTEEEFVNRTGKPISQKSEADKAAFAAKIRSQIEGEDLEPKDESDSNDINPKELGEWAKWAQKEEYGKFGPSKADLAIQADLAGKRVAVQPKLSLFKRLKLWFMRLFNKNYVIPEMIDNTFYMNASPEILKQKEEALKESARIQELHKEDKKRKKEEILESIKHPIKTIRKVLNKPSTKKQKFKDPKKTLLRVGAAALALSVLGIGGYSAYNAYTKDQLERRAQEQAQEQADLEAQRKAEEQQALQEALEQQEAEEQADDVLVYHSADELTTGSADREYLAPAGLEYAENSLGQGRKGTLAQDTVVEVYNRAIVDDNGILFTSNEQTWEDYAESVGMSMEDLEKVLNEDGNREMVAIQVADTNHNIFNVYGWVDATKLEENREGEIELVQGDNTEMLKQLQQQEQEGER